jgi:hypothetical protein
VSGARELEVGGGEALYRKLIAERRLLERPEVRALPVDERPGPLEAMRARQRQEAGEEAWS